MEFAWRVRLVSLYYLIALGIARLGTVGFHIATVMFIISILLMVILIMYDEYDFSIEVAFLLLVMWVYSEHFDFPILIAWFILTAGLWGSASAQLVSRMMGTDKPKVT